jgi:hypothetical protein
MKISSPKKSLNPYDPFDDDNSEEDNPENGP